MVSSRVVLHVGTMKSGTSYLQSRLFANRRLLRERGVLVPGRRWAEQVKSFRSLARDDGEAWQRQAEQIHAFEGTSVVSMEFLGPLPQPAVRRAVQTFAGTDLTVVITARDLNRSLPAMWQETVQNGATWTWAEYLAGAEAFRPGRRGPAALAEAGRSFWKQQDLARMCETWRGEAGGLTLITVPPPGAPRGLLWERFAHVLGTDPAGPQEARRANESIGAASAMVLRRVNELLAEEGLGPKDGAILRKRHLGKQILAARAGVEPAIGLDVAPWVAKHYRRLRARLETLDLDLVGDLGDLDPVPVHGIDPAEIEEADLTRAALAGLTGLLAREIRDPRPPRRRGRRGRRGEGHGAGRE